MGRNEITHWSEPASFCAYDGASETSSSSTSLSCCTNTQQEVSTMHTGDRTAMAYFRDDGVDCGPGRLGAQGYGWLSSCTVLLTNLLTRAHLFSGVSESANTRTWRRGALSRLHSMLSYPSTLRSCVPSGLPAHSISPPICFSLSPVHRGRLPLSRTTMSL